MKKVLVVEDSESFRKETIATLETENKFEITEAKDGSEGFDFLMNQSYDLVILDYHLPQMTGVEILRKLKDNGRSTNCPVIMLTSEYEERGSEIKQLNVVSWVIKPINQKRFKDLVDQVLDYYASRKLGS
ncbi:response regulator [Pseudobacteriovorax antillogorgiicola]|uniref:Two-component system, chemotaxis family, response regulator CheY n=1 Tax=Pseudobacteriovorax antillogorgiicola TaxID=1513793 RepID=A0A1Y6BMP0_9BACT|nr:response regulator [Pseudobacteriovorax antillogorgiicola]TCS55510.1 two-component system chemotaxis response regulator CheY [Pseudobacteriovorax antillogorgiicola]SMF11489.1 two-component system, chemotaxis family, response regulator CheY [Pseudobacteriovorax antillogorgiicola]